MTGWNHYSTRIFLTQGKLMPKILNITQLANRLGVTRQTVHNMLNEDRIPVDPIPGLKPLKWRENEIDTWLNPENNEG